MAMLKATCHLCKESVKVNGQKKFEEWAKKHKHLSKQSEIDWKCGKSISLRNA